MSRRSVLSKLSSVLALLTMQCNGYQEPVFDTPLPGSSCSGVLAEAEVRTDGNEKTVLHVRGCPELEGARLEILARGLHVPGKTSTTVRVKLQSDGTNLVPHDEVPLTRSLTVVAEPASTLFDEALLVLPYDPQVLTAQGSRKRPAIYGGTRTVEGTPPPLTQIRGAFVLHDERNSLIGARIPEPRTFQGVMDGEPLVPSNELDALFVIDNSGSMANKQIWLGNSVESLFNRAVVYKGFGVEAQCVQYRLGLITTDMGPAGMNTGDNAELQTKYCYERNLTGDAQIACDAACPVADRPVVAYPSSKFLEYKTGDMASLIAQHTKQFKCAAIVGDKGSSVEQPLASIKKFLDEDKLRMKAAQFFRSEALSAFVVLTDEEDCSLRPGMEAGFYGSVPGGDHSLHCINHSMTCDPPDMNGVKKKCKYNQGSMYLRPVEDHVSLDMKPFFLARKSMLLTEQERLRTVVLRSLFPLPRPLPVMGAAEIEHKYATAFYQDPVNSYCADATVSPTILGHPGVRLHKWYQEFRRVFAKDMNTTKRPQVEVKDLCDKTQRQDWLNYFAQSMFEDLSSCKATLR